MKKNLFLLVIVLVISTFIFTGCEKKLPTGPMTISLWHQEGQAEGAQQYVESLAAAYSALHDNITIETLNKETEALREDFQTASLAGDSPELLWTVSDHAGPFVAAGLIQPVEKLFKMKDYVDSVDMEGHTWGVPISSGNHLMMMYNKNLVAEIPKDTDEFIKVAKDLTSGDVYGLVWNQTEPFWLVPWLGGFGGKVFADDGITPTLNTKAMTDTLQFFYDLKYTHGIIPMESDYAGADTLFKEGKAAFLINGDWSLGEYKKVLGDKFGVGRMPKVSGGSYPMPYTSGKYFMIPDDLTDSELIVVKDFVKFATNVKNQIGMVETLSRLPGFREAMESEVIKNDPYLKGSVEQLAEGTPMPTVLEMRCNWDSMKPELIAVLSKSKTPEDASKDMQKSVEACIKTLE